MADIAYLSGYTHLAIIDHDYYGNTADIDGIPVIDSERSHTFDASHDYFLAVSWFPENSPIQLRNKQKRKQLIDLLTNNKISYVNLIHPSAIVAKTAKLGKSIMICGGAILGNHTVIEDFVQIREHSYLAHHAVVKKNSIIQVYGYVGSNVTVGEDCYLGIRSSCMCNFRTVPDNTFIKSHVLYTDS